LPEPRRLEVPATFAVADLVGSSPLTPCSGGPSRRRWTLYDTADRGLLRAGAEVAYAREDGWRIALPAGPQLPTRTVHRAGGASPPPAVRQLVVALTGGRPLERLAELEVTSVPVAQLPGRGGEPAVLVTDEEVTVLDADRVVTRFGELVLTPGPRPRRRDLDRVAAVLARAGARPAPPTARRLEAVLGARVAPSPPVPADLPRDATVEAVVRATLADGLTRLVGADPHARLGEDPEGVHQLRVATRRLRANLRTWRHQLDPRWVDGTREELAWLAILLGEVRDADVREARLRGHLEELGWPQDAEMLLAHAAALAAPARERLRVALGDPRYLRLLDRLRAAVVAPPVPAHASSIPASDVVLDVVGRSWRRLRDEVRALPSPPTDASLHAVRLRAKRFRFAAEAALPLVGRPAERSAAAAEALQEVLGELQDAAVTRAWLAEVARARPGLAFRCGELAGLEHTRAAAARARWPDRWSQLRRRRARRWFRPDH
jgi:CHAD domain-containing protein